MAKFYSTHYCTLFSGDNYDEFAHLDTLRMVIDNLHNEELARIVKTDRKGGRLNTGGWSRCSMRSMLAWCCSFARWLPCGAICMC